MTIRDHGKGPDIGTPGWVVLVCGAVAGWNVNTGELGVGWVKTGPDPPPDAAPELPELPELVPDPDPELPDPEVVNTGVDGGGYDVGAGADSGGAVAGADPTSSTVDNAVPVDGASGVAPP